MNYDLSVRRLLKFAIFLIAAQVPAQETQPRLVSHVDLRYLGLKVPAKGNVSDLKIEILFLSNSRLLLLDWSGLLPFPGGDSRLSAIEVSSGTVVRTMDLTGAGMKDFKSWGQVQRVSDVEFALAQSKGILFCNAELECRVGPRVSGPFRFSEESNRFIVAPDPPITTHERTWLLFDRESRQLGSYSEDPESQALVESSGVFFASAAGLHFYPTGQTSAISLRPDASSVSIALLGADSVAYLSRRLHRVAVVTSAGLEPYRLAPRALPKIPWDARLVSSAQGGSWGVEWTANSWVQLLDPLACIDECPAPAVQQFVVFSSANGKLVHPFKWDPRPWNLYVKPALSPDGHFAALVQGDSLNVYALE
jgi:hypothetical protein